MKSLFHLNKYLWKYKWHLFLGLLFIIASNYFGVYMPKIIDDTIDELINLDGNYQKDNNIIWNLVLKIVNPYMTFSLIKGLFLANT